MPSSPPGWTTVPVLCLLLQKKKKRLRNLVFLTESSFEKLWMKAAARVSTRTNQQNEILRLVYKSLSGVGPENLLDLFMVHKPSSALRPAGSNKPKEPRVRTWQFQPLTASQWAQMCCLLCLTWLTSYTLPFTFFIFILNSTWFFQIFLYLCKVLGFVC